jgi:CBS domain containing-hemolysin-like protein
LLTELFIILVLVLVNGIFSGAEIAIVSLRKTRLAELVAEGKPGARSVAELRAKPEGFLATVQIGITVVGATAAAFGGSSMASDIAPAFRIVPGMTDELAEDLALASVVAIVSFLSLVLGELVPKSLALRAGETYALLAGGPLLALAWVLRPLVAFLTGASNVVLRVFGDRTTFTRRDSGGDPADRRRGVDGRLARPARGGDRLARTRLRWPRCVHDHGRRVRDRDDREDRRRAHDRRARPEVPARAHARVRRLSR